MLRFEKAGIAFLVFLLVALPIVLHGWPATVSGNLFLATLLASAVIRCSTMR